MILLVLILTFKPSVAGVAGSLLSICCFSAGGPSPGESRGGMSLKDLERAIFAAGSCCWSEFCCCWSAAFEWLFEGVFELFLSATASTVLMPTGEVGALKLVVLFIWHQYCLVCLLASMMARWPIAVSLQLQVQLV